MSVPATVGTPIPLAIILEDGNTAQFPRVEIYSAGATFPLIVLDLPHKARGRYEANWTPSVVSVYSSVFIVYSDVAHTIESIVYTREIEQIFVTSSNIDDLAAVLARVLGLVHENAFIDETVFDSFGQLDTCRIRTFDSRAHVELATDGGNETLGLIATYRMEADYRAAGQLKTYRYKRTA
jgi:hypothetical protein